MQSYQEVRERLAKELLRDARMQDEGCFEDIGKGFDEIDLALARGTKEEFDRLRTAMSFWEAWMDTSYHDWRFYEPLVRDDWPVLAREIAADLQADRVIENPKVLAMLKGPPPVRNQLRDWLLRLFNRSSDHPT